MQQEAVIWCCNILTLEEKALQFLLFATVLSSQRPLVSQHSSNPFAAAALTKSWIHNHPE
jgi:hypothetical protein